jgi:hypothetical protein
MYLLLEDPKYYVKTYLKPIGAVSLLKYVLNLVMSIEALPIAKDN